MSYYDHATAMAFKLDRWSEATPLRNYEQDALACNRHILETSRVDRRFQLPIVSHYFREAFAYAKRICKIK